MRKQQDIWRIEHTNSATLPTMANTAPASGVVAFLDWVKKNTHIPNTARVVDIGCGQGRHAVYLAEQGYDVDALDYIEFARLRTRQLAQARNVAAKVKIHDADIDKIWPFSDNSFDLAIDSFSSIDIETKSGREMCRDEMYRTLKPGGYVLVSVCSADDEWESEMIAKHPGPEPNSTYWPTNGKFQKDYTKEELIDFYSIFSLCELRAVKKPAYKLGRHGTATNFWLVLTKKAVR